MYQNLKILIMPTKRIEHVSKSENLNNANQENTNMPLKTLTT